MTGFDMKSIDDIFGVDDTASNCIDIPLSELDSFPEHPFKVIDNEDMEQLVESIKINGIINPAIVKEASNGRYIIISGHRRKRACELAGLRTLKCVIADVSDDEAAVYMVDSNFQRTKVLPSEKAFAYKMRMDAMKRQGKRNDLTCAPLGHKSENKKSRDVLSQQSGESREQIRRYIRLTQLIPELLDFVDIEKIKLRPAVELSYIPKEMQDVLLKVIIEENIFPSQAQAEELRELSENRNFNSDTVSEVLSKKKARKKEKDIKIPIKKIQSYFPSDYTSEQILNEIFEMLAQKTKEGLHYDSNSKGRYRNKQS